MGKDKYSVSRAIVGMILFWLVITASGAESPSSGPGIRDIFDRDISAAGITLMDWEGYMANPCIEVSIVPPAGASFPASVTVTVTEPRLYFSLPSKAGANGPEKQLQFLDATPLSLSVAIFPAREKKRFDTSLDVQWSDAGHKLQVKVPVHVIYTEKHDPSPMFPITVDFSQDKTGFYKDKTHQDTFKQAVQDWNYYLADLQVGAVSAHTEKTTIFDASGFTKARQVTNAYPYVGFLLYSYGIIGPEMRSGGEPSREGKFQTSGSAKLLMKRSGGVEVEADGNYNRLGWMPPLKDAEWWMATNLGKVQNDMYSIVHHEIGHALFFNPNNASFPRGGQLRGGAIEAYFGAAIPTDRTDHFNGSIDPASLHGAFGNEYHGLTPLGRWLITKLDLLCAEAVGYKLRAVDALAPLALRTSRVPDAVLGKPYKASLVAEGGIPSYDWSVSAGALPAGLSLDRFTGEISGTPGKSGRSGFTVFLRDYTKNSKGISQEFALTVTGQ